MSKQTGLFSIAITLLSLFLIIYITLFPLEFRFTETVDQIDPYFFLLGKGETHTRDILENIFLFMPFGFGFAGILWIKIQRKGIKIFFMVFMFSFILSYTIEILQTFQVSRFPSIYDVFSNSTGGFLGFLFFRLWEYMNLHMKLLMYVMLTYLISVPLQMQTSLSNWDKTFPLLLGNELTEDRPWTGIISGICIVDKALPEADVNLAFSGDKPCFFPSDSLLSFYHLDSKGTYHDETEHIPDLVWSNALAGIQQEKKVLLNSQNWLQTAVPTEYLTQSIMRTNQFTLGITVATNDFAQAGPARIISLSVDPDRRNFTLGQQEDNLVFRVRTPLTGDNGGNPQMIIPDVFSSSFPKNLIITYDGSLVRIFVENISNYHKFELTPLTALFSFYFDLKASHLRIYKILYYAMIFIPLGFLLSLSLKKMHKPLIIKVIGTIGVVLFACSTLEGLLTFVSGKNLSLENLFISIVFTSIFWRVFGLLQDMSSKKFHR